MALRLIQIVVADDRADEARSLVEEEVGEHHHGLWSAPLADERRLLNLLLEAERCEAVIDALQEKLGASDDLRIVLLPVEATVPRPEEPDEEGAAPEKDADEAHVGRVSREELYADVDEMARVGWLFLVLVALSTVVATVGLVRGSVAEIVGAMVIAPLLGPNVALALATTLGDVDLARRALRANGLGVVVTVAISAAAGLLLGVAPYGPQIAPRTAPGLGDMALALASGAAGVLTFTSGTSTALVGVMVAVALLPPLVVCGLLLGAGHFPEAAGALVLVVVNVICINLAGVVTFLAQGVHPMSWWDAERARKATIRALLVWTLLTILLLVALFYWNPSPPKVT